VAGPAYIKLDFFRTILMNVPLHNRPFKFLLVVLSAFAAFLFSAFSARDFLAAHYASRSDLKSLETAVRLQPGNADLHYRVGRYYSLIEQSPQQASQAYLAAIQLNPNSARYWLDLAGAYQWMGDTANLRMAVDRAVATEPTTPQVAWEAANYYLVQGDNQLALREFAIVLANDPYLPPAALQFCWRIKPDIDVLLRDVVPAKANVYSSFLELMVRKNETEAAARIWDRLMQLREPVPQRSLYPYIAYLIAAKDPDRASTVWKQAAPFAGLTAYLPSSDNLLVNPDFNLEILNRGFDWMYTRSRDVTMALDTRQHENGRRSLRLIFDTHGIEDAGIRQLVPVQPNTSYAFSAHFRAEDLDGVGGPRFLLQDFYSKEVLFAGDDLENTESWKSVSGKFTSGPDTKLLVVRIQRNPAGSPIKGKLWIDGLRLVKDDGKA
jgi:tetratricopeptide (TPR) repeat protein